MNALTPIYAARSAIAHLRKNHGQTTPTSLSLCDMTIALAALAAWRLPRAVNEVGTDFLLQFLRMTVGYWGPHLDCDQHTRNQTHAFQTADQPILMFDLWRGGGLTDNPKVTHGIARRVTVP